MTARLAVEINKAPEDGPTRLDTVAHHEAGHAVMRWLLGYPAGELRATDEGGVCRGTGRAIVRRDDYILLCLAGLAVDSGFGYICFRQIDLYREEDGKDLDKAHRALDGCVTPRGVEEGLEGYFDRACELLWAHADLVERIGVELSRTGRLSARSVAALCREHGHRMQTPEGK